MATVDFLIASDAANDDFRADVLAGLSRSQKSIPCKYLYDERGSYLFDQICTTKEYYPTRAELEIMRYHASEMAAAIGVDASIVEYGSGSSIKTRLLLDSVRQLRAYVPVDISKEHLHRTAEDLQHAYPWIRVLPVVADFTKPFCLPPYADHASRKTVYFPGSTIGNLTPRAAGELLNRIGRKVGREGSLLLGIDLVKDARVLEAAYNDTEGWTAAFNLNLLTRMNAEFGADFELDHFEHEAVYVDEQQRIEVSIVSTSDQSVTMHDEVIDFRSGEKILTEYSHKYTLEGFRAFAAQYGFSLSQHWMDSQGYFAVLHLVHEG